MRVGERLTGYHGLITGVPVPREGMERTTTLGLDPLEQGLLARLVERGESAIEGLGEGARHADDVARALTRLVDLNHVLTRTQDGKVLYRPVSRPTGAR